MRVYLTPNLDFLFIYYYHFYHDHVNNLRACDYAQNLYVNVLFLCYHDYASMQTYVDGE